MKTLLIVCLFSSSLCFSYDRISNEDQGNGEIVIFEEIRDQILQLYDQEKTYEAFKSIGKLYQAIEDNRLTVQNRYDDQTNDEVVRNFTESYIVKRLKRNKEAFDYRYPQLYTNNNWNKFMDTPDQRIYTKQEEKFPEFISQFLDTVIDTNYMNVITLMSLTQAQKHWIPQILDVKSISKQNRNRQLVYQRYDLPLLFQDREGYFEASAFVIPEDEAFVIILDSVQEQYFGIDLPREPETQELLIKMSMMYIKPLSENRTIFKFVNHLDPRLEYIPSGIIEYGMQITSVPFLNFIKELTIKLPPYFKDIMIQEKEHFKYLEELLKPLAKYGEFNLEQFLEKNFPEKKMYTKFKKPAKNEKKVSDSDDL